MAVDRNSNSFTFIFAVIMVVVVGAALSFTSLQLKPLQEQNAIQKEMISILRTAGVEADRKGAADLFYVNIKERITLNHKGEVVNSKTGEIDPKDTEDPFNVDVQKEYRDRTLSDEDKHYPLYLAEVNGKKIAIIPMVGKGLWGPIWGYVALESDFNTIFGAVFDHKGETPGLGAEIAQLPFQEQFVGKTIYEAGEMVSIEVTKGAGSSSGDHEVDGITGGTITSKGVQEMLQRTFKVYNEYFKENKPA